MKFSKLHIENWRNFTHVDVPLQQRMFLIGANATGKSNLLDVFRFLRDIVRIGGGFEKAVIDRGGFLSLHSLFAPGNPSIVVDVQIGDNESDTWRYRLAFGQDINSLHKPILQEEKVWKSDTLLLNRPDGQDASDKELLRQTRLEQIIANREFREIADFFNSIHYSHIVPQIVREPDRSTGRVSDPYGGGFLEQIASLPAEVQNPRLKRIEDVLRAAVPQFRDLYIGHDTRGAAHLLGMFGLQKLAEPWQTEVNFSDGTLRLIGLLWALLDGDGPLLLEEPELSLHQAIVRYLPAMMWSIQREYSRQILVSTHSDDLLQDESIASDEILILLATLNGTEVKVGVEIDTVKHLLDAGLSVAEAALPETRPPSPQKLLSFGE